jgi:predicted nucleotidyltransferase
MRRNEVLEKLKSVKPILKARFGIETLALFGSVSRDEASPSSDVDLAIISIEKKDLFKRMEAREFLENYLGRPVDLGYYDAIRPMIKREISKDLTIV